ncbi:MAG TPA: hypothetical protein VNZ64_11630 [Candidatus Acidoferrum sp.]|nr:hypothetical protein [Candidatus Acidoferrum sp.]
MPSELLAPGRACATNIAPWTHRSLSSPSRTKCPAVIAKEVGMRNPAEETTATEHDKYFKIDFNCKAVSGTI